MKELFSTLRLALYVLALPLTVTAMASAHQWMNASVKADAEKTEMVATHVVRLTENGMIKGVVNTFGENGEKVAVSNANATLIKNGELVTKVKTGVDGMFSMSNLEPGVYTFVTAGRKGLATFGMEIVDSKSEKGVSTLSVLAAPPSYNSMEKIVKNVATRNVSANEEATAVIGGVQQVRLTADGSVVGRVSSLNGIIKDNKATLIQNDSEVATVELSESGEFELKNIKPGIYTFAAYGDSGLATVAMEVVAADFQAAKSNDGPIYTSMNQGYDLGMAPIGGFGHAGGFGCGGCCDSVAISMAPVCETIISEEIIIDQGVCCPMEEVIVSEEIISSQPLPLAGPACAPCAGGFGGSGGFGGGGFGGGGFNLSGIGDLIGLGIGAWLFSEIIDQIDDDNDVPRVPQPIQVPNPPPARSGFTTIFI